MTRLALLMGVILIPLRLWRKQFIGPQRGANRIVGIAPYWRSTHTTYAALRGSVLAPESLPMGGAPVRRRLWAISVGLMWLAAACSNGGDGSLTGSSAV